MNKIWNLLYRSNVIIRVIPIKIQHINVKQRRQIFDEQFYWCFSNVFEVFMYFDHVFMLN